MNKSLRKIIGYPSVIIILILLGAFLCTEKKPFRDKEKMEILFIEKVQQGELIDITENTDLDEIKNALMLMRIKRFPRTRTATLLSDERYEIGLIYQGKRQQVVLGVDHISQLYTVGSWGKFTYEITDEEEWGSMMQKLVEVD